MTDTVEFAFLGVGIIMLLCSVGLLYAILSQLPEATWKYFKSMREKEAEDSKNKQLDSEREEFDAWKSTQKSKSPPVDKPADSLDINDESNWYQ